MKGLTWSQRADKRIRAILADQKAGTHNIRNGLCEEGIEVTLEKIVEDGACSLSTFIPRLQEGSQHF